MLAGSAGRKSYRLCWAWWVSFTEGLSAQSKALAGGTRPEPEPFGIHAKQHLITPSFSLWSQGDVGIYFNRSSSMALISLMYFFFKSKHNQKLLFFILLSTQSVRNENIKYLWNRFRLNIGKMKAFSGIPKNKNISLWKTDSFNSWPKDWLQEGKKKMQFFEIMVCSTLHNVHLVWLSVKSCQNSKTPYKMVCAPREVWNFSGLWLLLFRTQKLFPGFVITTSPELTLSLNELK